MSNGWKAIKAERLKGPLFSLKRGEVRSTTIVEYVRPICGHKPLKYPKRLFWAQTLRMLRK